MAYAVTQVGELQSEPGIKPSTQVVSQAETLPEQTKEETVVSPAPTPEAQSTSSEPAPAQAPVAYKWAAEMAAAGIAEADYGHVTALLLDDNGWTGGNGFTWQKAHSVYGRELVYQLYYANRWIANYQGGWAEAHALVDKAGNF